MKTSISPERVWNAVRLWGAMAAGAAAITTAVAVPPAIPTVDLSLGPVAVTTEAANIALALSVEFPTVGAAYRTGTYDHTTTYLGYWDPLGCYAYKDTTSSAPLSGEYFYRTGSVDSNRYCNTSGSGTGYSGNALNFIASSAIDILRYALTGGNRVVDDATTTVLERAYLYKNWGLHDGYFPARTIPAALEGKVTPDFPDSNNQDVYAGSCKDRIWFGRSNAATGCDGAGGTNSGNLNQRVATSAMTVAAVDYNSSNPLANIPASHQSSFGFALGTVTWEISNPLVTNTAAPSAGPTTDTYVQYISAPGTTTTQAPAGPVQLTPVSYTYTANGTSTTPTLGSPNTNPIGYITATTGIYDSSDPGVVTGRAFTLTNDATANTLQVCVRNGRIWGRLNSSSQPTSTGVNNSWCDNPSPNPSGLPVSSQTNATTLRSAKGWPNFTSSASATFYEIYTRTAYYQKYTVTPVYQNWQPQTVYRYYEQRQYYTYYATSSPGPMYARVKVCDSAEAATRTDLCERYPSGNYKPVGEIQRRSTGARLSAFGYAMQDGNDRYGGVLRAPMSYVGPVYKDSNGIDQTNTQKEWDANTGVFLDDPRSAAPTFAGSGVINYLNKFGTTGTTKGTYKSNDPVGELYFEALRYFMGLSPTPAAISNMQDSYYDGFPIYGSSASGKTLAGWTDPVQNSCQRRNYILAIGDVNTHYDKQLPGHNSSTGVNETSVDAARAAENLLGSGTFNVIDWTKLVSAFETGSNLSYVDEKGRTQNTLGNPNVISGNNNLATKGTGASSSAYYWAGAAYWANTQPIRRDTKNGYSMDGVRVKTFTIDVDENGNGVIDGNIRGIKPRNSSFYLAGKYGWFNDSNFDGNPFKKSGGDVDNSEWEDAAVPNTPEGYVIASQAQKMIDGIRKFFAAATSERGAVSVSALSSQRFTSNDPNGDLFAPRFNPNDWSGTVQRSRLKFNTSTDTIETEPTILWDAGTILTQGSVAAASSGVLVTPGDRKIFTMSRDSGTMAGQAFTVDNKNNLDAAVRTALNTNPINNSVDNNIDDRINWLRGARDRELGISGGYLRTRKSVMGDVINSGPIYKRGVDEDVSGLGYDVFAASTATRAPAVYVGANDGMLHAFRAVDGKELFGYIPRAVSANLNRLTASNYTHRPFVDGVPYASEAQIGTTWKTVLVSGMGGGAQGVFALDVTNPESFGAGNVLWEFTDADDPDMGNVVLQPKLVKMKVAGSNPVAYKWFVAVGSGYNNYQSDGNVSTTGNQALFLLSLDKAAGTAWTLNTNYYKITVGAPASTTTPNGIGNPGFVRGQFGEATILYVGDLHGNLWKLAFPDGIGTDEAAASIRPSGGSPVPLAIARDASNNRQPITITPIISPGLDSGYMVVVGTGKFMEPSDSSNIAQQSVYGIWDSLSTSASDYQVGRSKLFQRTINAETSTVSGSDTFLFGNGSSGTYRGWYADLPYTSERIGVEGARGLGYTALNSAIPVGECSGDGSGVSYCFNSLYGTLTCDIRLSTSGFLSRPIPVLIDDSLGQFSYGKRSATGRRTITIRQTVFSTGSQISQAGNTTQNNSAVDVITAKAGGRSSWREIRNFREN